MKELRNIFKKYKMVCFLDFEATQFDHQLIAVGGVSCKVNHDGTLGKEKDPMQCFVQTKSNIGSLVKKMTNIDEKLLKDKGITFPQAMNKIKGYCGTDLKSTLFVTFGFNDIIILRDTYRKFKNEGVEFFNQIRGNYLDASAFISKYIKSPKGTNLSLTNLVKLYNLEHKGELHDPVYDAINLKNVVKEFDINISIFVENYLNLLLKYSKAPSPIIKSLRKLSKTKDSVSYEELISFIKEDFND